MVVKGKFSRVFIFLNELPYVLLHDLSLLREKKKEESLTGDEEVFKMIFVAPKVCINLLFNTEIWLNPPNLSQLSEAYVYYKYDIMVNDFQVDYLKF